MIQCSFKLKMFQDHELAVDESSGEDGAGSSALQEICRKRQKSIPQNQKAERFITKVADMVGYKGKVDLKSDSDASFEAYLKKALKNSVKVLEENDVCKERQRKEIQGLKHKLEQTETEKNKGVKMFASKAGFTCEFESGSDEFVKLFHAHLEDLVISKKNLFRTE